METRLDGRLIRNLKHNGWSIMFNHGALKLLESKEDIF